MARVPSPVTELTGRAHVLTATGHHPYARLTTGGDEPVRAFLADRATAWLTEEDRRPILCAFGDPEPAVQLVAALADRGVLAGVRRLGLPRVDSRVLGRYLPVSDPDHWEFRWTTTPPPPQPGQARVVRLGCADTGALDPGTAAAIEALLDHAFPTSFGRTGDPGVRRWYGIWERNRLVACGADRSRGGVGSLARIAVHPQARGRGLGATLTAAMAHAMCAEFDTVSLGVMVDNHRALRLYRRLGFAHPTGRTSIDLTG